MSTKNSHSPTRRVLGASLAGLLGLCALPASAQVAGGDAYSIKANINVAGLLDLDVGPVKQVQIAPQRAAYALQDQLQEWTQGNAVATVSAGTLQSALQWLPGASQFVSGAESAAVNLNVEAVSLLGGALISISANQVRSLMIISGSCPAAGEAAPKGPDPDDLGDVINDLLYRNGFDSQNLLPVNEVELPGLVVRILGVTVPNLPLNPPPNTRIGLQALGLEGATLVLNERVLSGDGVQTLRAIGNALHLTLNVAGIVTADVELGHADTSVNCSP